MKEYKLDEIKYLKVHGRTAGSLSPLPLFWTGSGIELNTKGAELWIEVEVDYELYEPWLGVFINSAQVSRQMLLKGRYWLCLYRGMNESTVKNVRIIREVQDMNGDPACSLVVHAVRFDGEFLPVEEKKLKIEFIGDSITSGEGVVGAKEEEDWISMWFSASENYTLLTANALKADYRVISESGWGVLTSWDNNPDYSIPQYYEKVCGVLTGEKNEGLGAQKENDFDAWQPDIVVVNLGTNDNSAFNSPEWRDEAGRSHKQRLNDDGSYNEEDLSAFEAAVENFLIKLRKYNKTAHIVWVYGMLGNALMPAIYRAVDKYRKLSSDKKVSVLQLPDTTEKTVGARSHPGILSHKKAAEELSFYLNKLINTMN